MLWDAEDGVGSSYVSEKVIKLNRDFSHGSQLHMTMQLLL